MDRGRIIDNIQNTNAMIYDQFGKTGKTSVRTTNPPGGKCHFTLGWDYVPDESEQKPRCGKKRFDNHQ